MHICCSRGMLEGCNSNKRVMALYTCVDKGNEKLACDALWPKYITPNGLGGHMTSDLKSATLNTRVSMCILSPTASEAMVASKQPQRSYDLRFEISNPDYPGIHVHVASNGRCGHDGLWGHDGLQMTSEVTWPQIWHEQPRLPWYPCPYCIQQPLWWPLRPWQPPNDLGGHIWPRNWTQWPQ